MTTAYTTRPMSEILAPAADPAAEAPTDDKPAAAAEEAPALPEKYAGKTTEDVIEMHQNAEQRLGQIQNELGTMRGLVTDLSALQRPAPEPQPAEQEPVDVSGDDLLSDPRDAVMKILQPELDKLSAASDQQAANDLFQAEGKALMDTYDVDAIVQSSDFQDFAARTPSRQADLEFAAKGTGVAQVRAARRLMEDFTDFQQTTSAEKTVETPVEKARKVVTESAGTGAPISGKPQIFEADVIALINSDPAKYRSPSYQNELLGAIKEGRFVKNT